MALLETYRWRHRDHVCVKVYGHNSDSEFVLELVNNTSVNMFLKNLERLSQFGGSHSSVSWSLWVYKGDQTLFQLLSSLILLVRPKLKSQPLCGLFRSTLSSFSHVFEAKHHWADGSTHLDLTRPKMRNLLSGVKQHLFHTLIFSLKPSIGVGFSSEI